MKRYGVLLLILVLAASAYLLRPAAPPGPGPQFSLQGLLGGDAAGYARATVPRPLRFPADHGPHPDYRSEWWYLTGNLRGPAGERYGFQFTIFRFALAGEPRGGRSAWGTRQAYMGHLALTDVAAGRMQAFERFSRGGAGLAGAQADPFAVWLEDWRLQAQPGGESWRLQAAQDGVGIALSLQPQKPPVPQGEQGLSRKGPEPGNASYYYSLPRLRAQGQLRLAGRTVPVRGSVWLDREWSTSALGPELAGWDWFALQFDDGAELMLYRLRRQDGGASPFSAGTYIPPQGPPRHLAAEDFRLEPRRYWTSPATGRRYPVAWQVSIPALEGRLSIAAAVPDQELDLAVRYWEGAVDVSGELAGEPAAGVGYMELTGYRGEGDGAGSVSPGRAR